MATKKPTHKRRRRKALSASPTRRRTSHRKGGLADMFNPTVAAHSFKSTLGAGAGGLGAMIVHKSILPPTAGKVAKIGTALVGGFIANAFGMSAIGNGFAGGMMALAFQNGLLADDDMQETEFADEDTLSDQPVFLDEAGEPMFLNDGGGEPFYQYLNEEEKMAWYGQNTY